MSVFTDQDIYLFKEGNFFRLYDKLGSHVMTIDGVPGTYFSVWAPNAERVSVIGDFNGWNPHSHYLNLRQDNSGIWENFLPGVGKGAMYKYHIFSRINNYQIDKADPLGNFCEVAPRTSSIVWDLLYDWHDEPWMKARHKRNALDSPMSIYEVHLGSWRRVPEEQNRYLTYRELAKPLADYVKDVGFTHVEFLPVMEHPYLPSWGYQITGYYAPTSRYGTPQDFMYLVDHLHREGIGVILDWAPSHFPRDGHGLTFFDGTHLYEHEDVRKGFHPEWGSYIFNFGRNEIRNFLIGNALFWMDKYHIDGMRVDAVASMLYLDYARQNGEWIPNQYGGNGNLEAVSFLKRLNEVVYGTHPDVQMIAEESTAWPMVSRPVHMGGLGFGLKWNMGWMHDMLEYITKEPIHRPHHHNSLTFSMWYAFTENFILPLSHDEVVHGKGSLIRKMPGDEWQKFANLRLFFGYMFTHPGKKILFMGGEFGQWNEWYQEVSLDWHLLEYAPHRTLKQWVKDLHHFYRSRPALFKFDFEPQGFDWMDFGDWQESVIAFIRKTKSADDTVLVVCNFTPVPRERYRIPLTMDGLWRETLNSDDKKYGGSGVVNPGELKAKDEPHHGKKYSLSLTLPPLGIIILEKIKEEPNEGTGALDAQKTR
ncbi:MAG: 1,4-alpha-glucan branching protein GlgB [Candidatus Omnitrophica bacterium]|nr:1,4-alpha-glucan branching protein GlgB [Candidatus Omnitrophota bacterium]